MNRIGKNCYKLRISFNPEYVNPLTGKTGQYRVITYQNQGFVDKKYFYVSALTFPFIPVMIMHATRSYRKGSIVNPTKILKDLLDESTMITKTERERFSYSEC